ncbi:phosphotransferase enzyme family protein [Kutzneria sp. 744]|uniref:phosphotransferase enzyme family protein n=1 Tax=Kutzneria sp. (strain 744) TaxID=345341 RepID=UPI0003EEAC48|nr:aminoglycoside phosphotransferase family protein [Kutzneria sp. 744]EWM12147.1 aminoglycoside phosphotransferase [Kutzneria sp. 744]
MSTYPVDSGSDPRAPWAVLTQACRQVGLDPAGAALVRLVNNAVFRLVRHRVMVRVTLIEGLAHRAHTAVSAGRMLAAHGIPAVRPLLGISNPVHLDRHAVSFWKEVVDTGATPTAVQLGDLLTRLHNLRTAGLGLPSWNPIAELRSRITATHGWDRGDVDFLWRRCEAVESALAALDYPLPAGVIHGDAHLGNMITTPAGPVLCDLDTVCVGPREWDLVPLAVSQLRFGRAVDVHRQLVDAYGVDITTWPGFPVLRELRELKLAAVGLPIAYLNPAVGAELRLRLRSLRAAHTTARWTPYQ